VVLTAFLFLSSFLFFFFFYFNNDLPPFCCADKRLPFLFVVLNVAPLLFVVPTAAPSFYGACSFPLFSLSFDVVLPSYFFAVLKTNLTFADFGPHGSAIVTILSEDPAST
jgi:hypothetical protein